MLKSAPFLQHFLQDFHSAAERGEFGGRKFLELRGEVGNAPIARFLQQPRTFGGGANLHAARVVAISGDRDQAAARQAGGDAGHGGRFDLLGGSEFA